MFGTGTSITHAERDFYTTLPNVTVRFQKNAWCDEPSFIKSLADFRRATLEDGEVLLGMDRHGPQRTPYSRAFMRKMHIFCMFTPANCTDRIAPCDHHVAKTLKTKMRIILKSRHTVDELMALETCDKRMTVAKAASEAWEDMLTNHAYLFRAAFVDTCTGWLVAMDGSENKLIMLEKDGRGKYDF